jgi:regulator of sigma D
MVFRPAGGGFSVVNMFHYIGLIQSRAKITGESPQVFATMEPAWCCVLDVNRLDNPNKRSNRQEHNMGSIFPGGADRRRRSREKLDALVSSRTTTLSLLAELAGKQPFTPEPSMEKALREFCEALIDYTASAHFQLYRYLADNRERRQSVISLADELYPRIVETTDLILRFNDKYESMTLDNSVQFLAEDLSRLGECLADRILLEDQVIKAMNGGVH